MKIIELKCAVLKMKLKESYSISYESIDSCDSVLLQINTAEGLTGFGIAAPDLPVTGETVEDVYERFSSIIEPFLKGRDVFEYAWILESLKEKLPNNPSARAMVDMALYDIFAQKAGVPLYQFLGGYRKKIATSITLGIMPIPLSLNYAMEHLKQGFKILKIKGGTIVEEDIEKIIRIRELAGKHIRIRFDANQGYTLEESIKFLKETANADVELLEQPTHRDDLMLLKEVTKKATIPIMADESLLSLSDVFQISRKGCSDLINIKLMKTGGIMEAMHINSVARAAGIKAMVGCMDESALGIAAALHFTLSRPNIAYADLDGHLDIVDDPFHGMIKIENGIIYPPESPGLGWTEMKNINFL